MRSLAMPPIALLAIAACGRVSFDPDPERRGDGGIGGPCIVHNSVNSCGAACARCPPANDRQTPICDGTLCSTACKAGAPQCSDGGCSRLLWTFDSGTLDGVAPRDPPDLLLSVRSRNGNPAIAIDVVD